MPLMLRGRKPKPGELDRRYYMIRLQVARRRVCLSSGVSNRKLAQAKAQLVLDALRADIEIPHVTLVELVRSKEQATRSRMFMRTRPPSATVPMSLKQACDEALRDRLPWGRSRRGWAHSSSSITYAGQLRDIQRILGPDLPVTRINQDSVNKIVDDLLSVGTKHGRPRNAEATINRKMFALFSVLRRLHERGLPAPLLPKYRNFDESDNARQFVFTAEQEQELFDQVRLLDTRSHSHESGPPFKHDAHAYLDLFVFLADVGCRLSAALNVQWSDVFEDSDAMYVRFFRRKH